MPKTPQELREWYQKFSQELYEKVQIDVTRKEDLGRVRVFKSDQWSVDNLDPDMQITYAYMSHDGKNYADPEPELGDIRTYALWMTKNLNPEVTNEQIQKLYEQSCAGELMVYKPGGSLGNIQMVLTDADGNITISVPGTEYDKENAQIPKDQLLTPPKHVAVPDPVDFGFPAPPRAPENMNPNWLSKLLDLFGIHTAYTDLKNYQKALADYPNAIKAWENRPEDQERFNQALETRADYERQAQAYMANPYSKHIAAVLYNSNRYTAYSAENGELDRQIKHKNEEQDYLQKRHEATPLGKLEGELKHLENRLSYFKETEQGLYDLTGHDPHPERLPNYKAFEREQVKAFYKPEAYELPPLPDSDYLTEEQEQAMLASWAELAAVAGFSATSDYDILGSELRPGCNREETANLKYSMVLPNLFTEFRGNINHELPCVEPARKLAKEALYAYSEGKPQQLGAIMARSLRQNVREAAGLNNIAHSNTWRTLYLVSKQLEMLDKYSDVRDASGLTPEELEEARGYAELYKVMMRGAEARKDLLEHALGKKTLSSVELEQAGKDALLASYAFHQVGVSYSEQTNMFENDPTYQKILKDLDYSNSFTSVERDADKAKKEGRLDEAETLYRTVEEMKQQAPIAKAKETLFQLTRTAPPINKNLLNENWVVAAKEQLAKNLDLPKILTSRKNIAEAFYSDFELAMSTKDLVPETKSAQLQKSLEINQPQLQNQAPQNSMGMK